MSDMTDSDRVFLRNFMRTDSTRLYEIESQPEVVRFQEFEPRTLDSSLHYIEEAIEGQSYEPRTCFEYAVCLAEGLMVGRVGGAIDGDVVWIWYVIDPAYQGQGLAKEAVRLFLPQLPPKLKVQIECDPRNIPSWKLAESLGFEPVSELASGMMIKGENCGSRVYMLEGNKGTGE